MNKISCLFILSVITTGLFAQSKMDEWYKDLYIKRVESNPSIQWQQFGPGMSGYCEIIEYHPTDPNCIMMSPDMYNTYGSWDNGTTWETVKDCDGNGNDMKRVRDYSFSRQNPDFGLALDVKGTLWITNDRGRSWNEAESFDKGICSVVEIDPHNDRVCYIGGGDFWNVKFNNRTAANPHHIKRNGAEYGKIWRSSDQGSTWTLINSGINKYADIGKILLHPLHSEIVYAATSYGLYKSSNQGDSWQNIGVNLPHNMIRDLDIVYDTLTNKLLLYAIDQVFWEDDGNGSTISTGGIFFSDNDGETWTCLNNNLYLDFTRVSDFVIDYYYRQLAKWFDITEYDAVDQYPEKPVAILQMFNRLIIDPSNPKRIYLGHNLRHDHSIYPGDLWVTEDGGKHWISCARIGTNWNGADKSFWEYRGNPTNMNMKFAHLRNEVEEDPYPWTGCRALTVSARGDVTAVFEQQTLQSTNNGESWQQIDDIETEPGSDHWVGTGSSNLPGRQIIMDPRMPRGYLFLSGEHGIWKMTNDGNKVWPGAVAVKQIEGQIHGAGAAFSIADIAIHPNDTNIIYALMFRQNHAGQVRRTLDGGKNWENITPKGHPIQTPDGTIPNTDWNRRAHQYSLIIDKENPGNMYFCMPSWVLNDVGNHRWHITTQFGVHRSTDGGYTWTRQNIGIKPDPEDDEDYAVNSLCFNPKNNKTIYAAVMKSFQGNDKGGLYVSTDSSDTWLKLPIPSEIVSVNDVHVDSLTGKIYIACGHKDEKIANGGIWVSSDEGSNWEKIFNMPLVFKVTTAPYDSGRIAAIVGPHNAINGLNPGAYLSFNGGETWIKANKGLGQPDRVKDLQFDISDPDILWSSLWGSGWYKGFLKKSVVAKASSQVTDELEQVVLDGSASYGDNLSFQWSFPGEISVEDPNHAVIQINAPAGNKDSTLIFNLQSYSHLRLNLK